MKVVKVVHERFEQDEAIDFNLDHNRYIEKVVSALFFCWAEGLK